MIRTASRDKQKPGRETGLFRADVSLQTSGLRSLSHYLEMRSFDSLVPIVEKVDNT